MKNPFLAGVLFACLASPAVAAEPTGEWLVADGRARIRIAPCNNALWGVISWAKNPGKDENNPDPTKRNRSIIGMPVLLNMKKTEPNQWEGEVYNAENGRTYASYMSLVKDDVLRIDGCVLGGIICGGENWTRVGPAQDKPGEKQKDICP